MGGYPSKCLALLFIMYGMAWTQSPRWGLDCPRAFLYIKVWSGDWFSPGMWAEKFCDNLRILWGRFAFVTFLLLLISRSKGLRSWWVTVPRWKEPATLIHHVEGSHPPNGSTCPGLVNDWAINIAVLNLCNCKTWTYE